MLTRYFPDGPGVKAPHCQIRGHGFLIWSKTEITRALLGSQKILKDMYMDLIVPFLTRDLGMIQFNVIES